MYKICIKLLEFNRSPQGPQLSESAAIWQQLLQTCIDRNPGTAIEQTTCIIVVIINTDDSQC